MKTLTIASLAAALSVVGLATLVGPTHARPTVSTTSASKPLMVAKPDLRCKIAVWEDEAGTMPVSNGASLGYGGGAPSLFAQVIITNHGSDAGPAANTVAFKRGGSVLESHEDTLAIPAGLSKIYPTFEIGLPSITNQVRVDVALDTVGAVAEASEINNACTFTATVTVVH